MRLHIPVLIVGMLALGVPLAATGPAYGQNATTGTLAGRIVDAQGLPVPGVTVTVTSAFGTKTFVTDTEGKFLAPFLTPGTYTVKAELQGFRPVERPNIDVSLGQQASVNLTMQVGGISETVQVVGETPVIDTSNTRVTTNIDSDALTRLPVQRRFSDALYIAPGVSSGGDVGAANPSVSGGSGLENQYIVDGVNITNQGYGALGSYSIVFGSLGNGTPFDFVKEIQVNTAGFEAENATSTGGTVNVVTKSGTNNLRGSAFGYAQPKQLANDYTQVDTINGTINNRGLMQADAGVEVGGPVIHNRLFFFGAFDPSDERRTLIAPVDFTLRSLGDLTRERRIYNYAAKATFQLNANHRFDASFFGDPARGLMGPQRNTSLLREDTAGFSKLNYGGHNQTVRYSGILSPNWLLEASWARARNNIQETPSVDTWSVTDTTVTPFVYTGGIGYYEVGNLGINNQFQAKATTLANGWGSHQFRYGVNYSRINYDNTIQRTGPSFVTPTGETTATGAQIQVLADPVYGKIYRVTRANLTNVRQTKQDYVAFFVQDTYKIGSHLTLQPGLRYEHQKLFGNLKNFSFGNNWAPRVGATYDPTGQGRMKIYGNYGLYYSVIPNDLAARALSADAGINRADYFDANLTQPIPEGVPAGPNGDTVHYLTAGLSASDFDPNARTTRADEVVGGFDWEAIPGWSFGARYIHRRINRVLEDIGNASITLYFTRPDLVSSTEYFITNPTDNYPATLLNVGAFEKPIHRYDALEVSATRRFANNWALQASYRLSRLYGDFEGFFRNDNGQSDPGITSLYDFPTNDPSYTEIGVPEFGFKGDIRYQGGLGAGPLPNDRRHQAKVYGNYQFPMGLNLGVGLTVGSGRPLTAMAANPVYENAGEIPMTPRGGGIQTTTDGFRTRTPFEYDTSLHADYRIRAGGNRSLVLLADVFNLFNTQRPLNYNTDFETTFGVDNPDFGTPSFNSLATYQAPRQLRVGARFEF